jgi:hypothetical protein
MKLNDEAVRRLCLPEGLTVWGEPVNIGRVPGIYDAVIGAIDGALKLGRQGGELDPWGVMEAAERFRALNFRKMPKSDPRLPMAIVEPGLASA